MTLITSTVTKIARSKTLREAKFNVNLKIVVNSEIKLFCTKAVVNCGNLKCTEAENRFQEFSRISKALFSKISVKVTLLELKVCPTNSLC